MNECSPGMSKWMDFNSIFKYNIIFCAILQIISSKAIWQLHVIAFEINAQGNQFEKSFQQHFYLLLCMQQKFKKCQKFDSTSFWRCHYLKCEKLNFIPFSSISLAKRYTLISFFIVLLEYIAGCKIRKQMAFSVKL